MLFRHEHVHFQIRPNINSGSGDLAYAGPKELPASDESDFSLNANEGLDVSTGLDPKPCKSTSEGCNPESDETISTSNLAAFNKALKSLEIADNPTVTVGSDPIEGECCADRSGCELCLFLANGHKPCFWVRAKCDPNNKNYCVLSREVRDGTGRTGLIQFEPLDISHIPSPENPFGQTWCTSCKKPEPPKSPWCLWGMLC